MPVDLNENKYRDYVISLFHEYLLREHRRDLLALASQSFLNHRTLTVHFSFLCEFHSIFSELLLVRPQETLKLLDEGLKSALFASTDGSNTSSPNFTVHTRLTALPVIPEVHRITIPWSSDVGKFVALHGTVSRVGPTQVLEGRRIYECTKCSLRFPLEASFDNNFALCAPRRCPNREKCTSTYLKPCLDGTFYAKNYQVVRVHELYRCLSVGVMPRSIGVCLEDDLLESVKPGDDVIVNGIVTRQWTLPREGSSCDISLWIKANSIENISEQRTGLGSSRVSNERASEFETFWMKYSGFPDALRGRNLLLRSICPEICGMYFIKLSIALLLAGSPGSSGSTTKEKDQPSGLCPSTRGCPHMLLIGDPGTAKSVLLRCATNLSNRAVLTAATGTTAAGLTATAVRDVNGWSLDAGALVLADGGLCAIDEFTALQGTHRSAVHEAMEQQTISLAKAGLVTRLNCRCSVLAAANSPPDGDLRKDEFGMPSPLLSRFDLIWKLIDPMNSDSWDRRITNFVLRLDKDYSQRSQQLWPVDRLREYFTWVRQEFKPRLSKPAASLLQRYYVWRRQHLNCIGATYTSTLYGRTTLRLLESLVRLTKAHARLMARSEATLEDAVIIIALMDASLQSTVSNDSSSGILGPSSLTVSEVIVSKEVPLDSANEYTEWANSIQRTLAHINELELVPSGDYQFTPVEINDELEPPHNVPSVDSDIQDISWSAFKLPVSPILTSTQLTPHPRRISSYKEDITSISFGEFPSECKVIPDDVDEVQGKAAHLPNNNDFAKELLIDENDGYGQRICNELSCLTPPQDDSANLSAKPLTNTFSSTCPSRFKLNLLSDVQLTDEDFQIDLS